MSTILRTTFQLFLVSLLLITWTTSAESSEPIQTYVRHARMNSANAMLEAQSKLEKGDLEGARRTADAAIKADPTFYVTYYIRARVFTKSAQVPVSSSGLQHGIADGSYFWRGGIVEGPGKLPPR
jgi:Tfp pilus assembly protein PilF